MLWPEEFCFAIQGFGLTEREAVLLPAAFNGSPWDPRVSVTPDCLAMELRIAAENSAADHE